MSTEEHIHHPTPAQYWKIAVVLAVLTAIEVAIYYIHKDFDLGNFNTVLLLVLAALQFVIVIGWYMHLRFEKSTLSRFFTGGAPTPARIFATKSHRRTGAGSPMKYAWPATGDRGSASASCALRCASTQLSMYVTSTRLVPSPICAIVPRRALSASRGAICGSPGP